MAFRAILLTVLLAFAWQAWAGERFSPGISYYFDSFDPAQKPWKTGDGLNYEEVFKNFQFYEIIFLPSGKRMVVNRYIRNTKTESELYLLNPDGSLSRQPGDL